MRPFGRFLPPASVFPGVANGVGRGSRWVILMALAPALACSTSTIAEFRELAIVITATPSTAAVNAPIEFRYDAMGPPLSGIIVSYGDGVADSVATVGATTAGGRLTHSYSAPGTFQVQATVIANNTSRASNTTSVEITP